MIFSTKINDLYKANGIGRRSKNETKTSTSVVQKKDSDKHVFGER